MKIILNEQLTEGFITLIGQFPPIIREMLDPKMGEKERNFRFLLFQAISSAKDTELTMDQVQAANLVEFLALGMQLDPPVFNPGKTAPGNIAQLKANSFVHSYLMNRYLSGLNKIGFATDLINSLSINAGDLEIAKIQKLQFNYNDHYKVANYLSDVKDRYGLLASMTGREAGYLIKAQEDVNSLFGQIANNLAVAYHIQLENKKILEADYFKNCILTGDYPLALLFARQSEAGWFEHFFHQSHRPKQIDFDKAQEYARQEIPSATEMGKELVTQSLLDIKVLPDNPAHGQLKAIAQELRQ